MKRTAASLIYAALIGLFVVAPVQAQGVDTLIPEAKDLLRAGFNASNIDQMREARALFERATQDKQHAALAHYYVALADSRLGNMIVLTDEKQGLMHIDQAIKNLKKATKLDENLAEAHALLSSVYGRKIGAKPLLGMIMGPKADASIKKARQLDSDNPRIVYIEAMSLFHKPKTWGGSVERAIEGLKHATELFAQEEVTDPLLPSWGHDEAYAWLGIAYMSEEQYDKAQAAFEKALELNPDFGWVREVLLPQLKSELDSP